MSSSTLNLTSISSLNNTFTNAVITNLSSSTLNLTSISSLNSTFANLIGTNSTFTNIKTTNLTANNLYVDNIISSYTLFTQSNTQSTTANNVPQLKLRLTTPVLPSGNYKIEYQVVLTTNQKDKIFNCDFKLNNTILETFSISYTDITIAKPVNYITIENLTGGSYTCDIYYYRVGDSMSVTSRNAKIFFQKIN